MYSSAEDPKIDVELDFIVEELIKMVIAPTSSKLNNWLSLANS
jgi:hypothetical protein